MTAFSPRTAFWLLGSFLVLLEGAVARTGEQGIFDVREYGARGDGRTLDTAAVNQAIAKAAEAGGGTVVLPAGEYLCHSIRLRSNITLQLGHGAVLIAAEPPAEAGEGYDAPEPNPAAEYQDFGHSHTRNSLIWGEDLENVAITGPGRIYGRGLSRGNGRVALPVNVTAATPPGAPPDVLEADGPIAVAARPDLVPGPFGYPNARDTLPVGVGNKAIALKRCRNVLLRDFTVLHGGHFAVLATGTDNLTIDNLTIDTNRDGLDIDGCHNVRISNCSVNAPWDDGICLKASYALGVLRATEDVTITNCTITGFDEGTLLDGSRQRRTVGRGGPVGRIKLGTEATGGFRNITITNCVFKYSRGFAIEQVDGGPLENVTISNIAMHDVVNAPIFLRLGGRLRAPAGVQMGTVRRILINNLTATGVAPEHGIILAGLPGHRIEDVVLAQIRIQYRGGGTEAEAARRVPEFERDYPDPYNFGTMPSWGLFARHVKSLTLRDVRLGIDADDRRPAVWLEDVAGGGLDQVTLDPAPARPVWRLAQITGWEAHGCTRLPEGPVQEIASAEY